MICSCRRKTLKDGYHDCNSQFSFSEAFNRLKCDLPWNERPYELTGIFYHSHKNEEKYHRNEYGGWEVNHVTKAKRPKGKNNPTVRNNMVYPLKCRGKFTVEEVLEAQKRGFSLTY